MDLTATFRFLTASRFSSLRGAAARLALAAAVSATGRAWAQADETKGAWSTPDQASWTPDPGAHGRTTFTRRNYKDGPLRVLDSNAVVDIKSAGSHDLHDLRKSMIYDGTKLSAYKRRWEMRWADAGAYISDSNEISRAENGEFGGSDVWEYHFGSAAKPGPDVLLTIRFQPYLLAKSNEVTVAVRDGEGGWTAVASARDESLYGAMKSVLQQAASEPRFRRQPTVELILALWIDSMSTDGVLPLPDSLATLLGPGGERFTAFADVDALTERVESGARLTRERQSELARLMRLKTDISKARGKLEKTTRHFVRKPSWEARFQRDLTAYSKSIEPLLAPQDSIPSTWAAVHENAAWLASAVDSVSTDAGSTPEAVRKILADGRRLRAANSAQVYLRALHALMLDKEIGRIRRTEFLLQPRLRASRETRLALGGVEANLQKASDSLRTRLQDPNDQGFQPSVAALFDLRSRVSRTATGLTPAFARTYLDPRLEPLENPEGSYSDNMISIMPYVSPLSFSLAGAISSGADGLDALVGLPINVSAGKLLDTSISLNVGAGVMGTGALGLVGVSPVQAISSLKLTSILH